MGRIDAPLRRAVDQLDLSDELIATGEYQAQDAKGKKLQLPQISVDNNEVDGTKYRCYWHPTTGVLIYVPSEIDQNVKLQ